MFMIVCLHQYDIMCQGENGKRVELPLDAPHSLGIMRSEEDLLISMKRRRVD